MNNDKVTTFQPVSAAELMARPPQQISWLWQNYIARGDLFIFVAYMKVGKSTFFYPLALAVARGTPFCGQETKQGGVLILALEEHPRDVELRLRKLGLTADDPVFIHEGPLPKNAQELAAIDAFIREKKIALVIIDSLAYWWDVKNENDNAEIVQLTKPLVQLARTTGAAVGLIHHENKYGGRDASGETQGDGKSIRGGSALFAMVDQALLLDRRHGGNHRERVLKAIGRHAESPPKLILALEGNPALSDPSPYSYRAIGVPADLRPASNREKVVDALTTEWKDGPTIIAQTGLSKKAVRGALGELYQEGLAAREGKGVRGDEYLYRLARDPDSFLSPGSLTPNSETNRITNGDNSFPFQDGAIEGNETNPAAQAPSGACEKGAANGSSFQSDLDSKENPVKEILYV